MTKAAKVKVENQKTYAFLILDKSGSMQSCKEPTIKGFNEQIQTIRAESKNSGEWFASVVTFNQRCDMPAEQWCQSPGTLQELNEQTYMPDGGTAMLDAVGMTLDRIKKETPYEDPTVSYLVIIVSDGEENSSREYNYSKVGELVQELMATNRFTFTYMGSNQDLSVINKQLHIPVGNTALYDSSVEGTRCAFAANTRSTREYMKSRSRGETQTAGFYTAENAPADFTKQGDTTNESGS